jgi:HAD superfamily hydrolase (TIGR01509 family)
MPHSPTGGAPRPFTILLDVDGTLIDSNDAHAHSWVDASRECGRESDFGTIRPMIGMGGDKLMPRAFGVEHDSPEGKKMSKRRSEIFLERYLPTLRPFPRARELLLRMREDGHSLVVATSAKKDEMKALLRAAGVEDLLEEKTSSSDADRSKPDPDIIAAALKKSDAEPDDARMLGDTPYDVEAATRAGVATVALLCGGWTREELRGAIAIYADPAELLREYDRSPLSATRR